MKEETDGFNRVQFIDGGNRGASAQNKQTKSKMGSAGRQWAADEGSAQEKQQRRENRNPEIRSRNLEQPSRRSKHRRTDKDKTDSASPSPFCSTVEVFSLDCAIMVVFCPALEVCNPSVMLWWPPMQLLLLNTNPLHLSLLEDLALHPSAPPPP
ncbi:hypothetical protein Q8A67_020725 [Cirrhinus molitorella]|uniref:Uncharacterized protein n=1 Tax=Cirrhinus molitorella TaxID=172907 RepID=A0AA88PD30_9TELE|nr:hypothetical protein Q8A67_020725 [Cirrhinus molitorella]